MSMMESRGKLVRITTVAVAAVALLFGTAAWADRFSSTSYIIDASIANNNGGGSAASTSYSLVSSHGETVIGNATGGSYKMGIGYVSQLTKSLQLTVQPNGLVMYVPLDENSGSYTYDSSASAYVGNLQASPTWATGKIGNALTFNGSSQYVSLGDIDVVGSAITVSAWVYPTAASQNGKILGKHSSTTDVQGTLGITSGNASFEVTTGGSYHSVVAASSLAVNAWSYVTGVYDGANAYVYVNGVLANSAAATGTLANNNLGWAIGRLSASQAANYYTGSVDEVKVLSRALSADEVLAEYNAGVAGNTAGVSLGTIMPGTSNTVLADVVTRTDAGGYSLAINQDHDLQNGSYTIPSISGTIGVPAAWSEGATKGLGFTLTATNATAIPAPWSSGANYAAFPGTATTFYTRTGLQSTPDYLTMRLRADVATTQTSLTTPYSNTVTVTGTLVP